MNWIKLLAVLAFLFVNAAFGMAIIYSGFHPRWTASYVAVLLLYSALYFRRATDLPEGLRRRLGQAALALASFLSSTFFYSFAADMTWWKAIAVWLGLAAVAYALNDIFIFNDGEGAELVQVTVQAR